MGETVKLRRRFIEEVLKTIRDKKGDDFISFLVDNPMLVPEIYRQVDALLGKAEIDRKEDRAYKPVERVYACRYDCCTVPR
jgi:hypothetical protein